MLIRALGTLEVWNGSTWSAVPAAQQRVVLAVLAARPAQVVSTDRLVDEIWGDTPPRTAVNLVQRYVMLVRRMLGDSAARIVVTRGHGYELAVDQSGLDILAFERLVEAGRHCLSLGQLDAGAGRLSEALALWRGPAMADVPATPVVAAEAARLDQRRLSVLEEHLGAQVELGRHAAVVDDLARLVREHPLREKARVLLMVALYRCGRRADALETYHEARQVLGTELGLEPGAALRDLHAAVLADEVQPGADGRAPAAAPLVLPAQLPADQAAFTGRRQQLRRLDDLLAAGTGARPGAVVISAIDGTAGVGKTATAVHWAHQVRDRFPDGQLFVDLRGHTTGPPLRATAAMAQFLSALGVPADQTPADEDHAAALYRSLTADRRMLVVLDNARDAAQVRPLLPGGRGCLVLVTSRNRLDGLVVRDGAVPLTFDVLTAAEAEALLVGLLGAGRVGAERAAVAELARLCGYLPLALRIAAAHLMTDRRRTIARYTADLAAGDRLDVLQVQGDPRAGVRAAFDLSYQALPAGGRRLFRLLGLVPGPEVTVAAAAALAGTTGADAAGMLDGLARGHLVHQPTEGRYALHDLLRLYAAERAAAEEAEPDRTAAFAGLAEHYLRGVCAAADMLYPVILRRPLPPRPATGATVTGPPTDDTPTDETPTDDVAASAWLDAERGNLVATVVHAATHGPHATAWQLADALRGYLFLRMRTADWAEVAAAGLAAADAHGDPGARAAAHLSLALLNSVQGRYPMSEDHYAAARTLSRQAGWLEGESAALGNLGNVYFAQGRLAEAAEHYARGLAIDRRTGWLAGQAAKLANLGLVEGVLGKLRLAAEHLSQALVVHRAAGTRIGEARNLANLGEAYHHLGRLNDALDLLTRALALHRELGDRNTEGGTERVLAAVRRDAGDVPAADDLIRTATARARDSGDRHELALCLATQASIDHHREHYQDAVDGYGRALILARDIGNRYVETQALVGLAAADREVGAWTAAAEHARAALTHARVAGYRMLEGRALTTLAVIDLGRDRPDAALAAAEQGLAVQTDTGDRLGQARTHLVAGAVHRRLGDDARARLHEHRARRLFTTIGTDDADNARVVFGTVRDRPADPAGGSRRG